ncbi:MAG: S-layer homology domain-containing protein [Acidobacteria bacterium]|nr:S-layer homology domain-containing protein [Acidobacteriota bacterium]
MKLRLPRVNKWNSVKLNLAAPPLLLFALSIIALILSIPSSKSSSYFSDVYEWQPFYNSVNRMYELGITSGYGDGTYRPEQPTDRGMAALFLVRAWSRKNYGSPNGFPDAPPGGQSPSQRHAQTKLMLKLRRIP